MVSSFSAGSTTRDTASRQAGGLGRDGIDSDVQRRFQKTFKGGFLTGSAKIPPPRQPSDALVNLLTSRFRPLPFTPPVQPSRTSLVLNLPPPVSPRRRRLPSNPFLDLLTKGLRVGGGLLKPAQFKQGGATFRGFQFNRKF